MRAGHAVAVVSLASLVLVARVHAHGWYPQECCSDKDCGPAETVIRYEDGSYLVTSRGMTVLIPKDYGKWRSSPDGKVHVCIRKLRSGSEYLVCAFRAPGS